MPAADPLKLSVLLSFAYLRTKPEALNDTPLGEWRFILDSGAFTNFTKGKDVCTLPDYIAFCKDHRGKFDHVVNMDRIGDPAASERNLKTMLDAGIDNVMPVFQRGGTVEQLRELCRGGHSLIGIGGVARDATTIAGTKYLSGIQMVAREEGQAIHILGVSLLKTLVKLRPYSSDSSSWKRAKRFGLLHLWGGGKFNVFSKLPTARSTGMRPDRARTKILRGYGLDWRDLYKEEEWKDNRSISFAECRSWMRMAYAVESGIGTRYVFAANHADIKILIRAWAIERAARGWQ